jgi:formate/nitrite transporter FocA (FNT family)
VIDVQVTLGIWQATAAQDLPGKIMGVYFPVLAFVAIGFDHVIANMFLVRPQYPHLTEFTLPTAFQGQGFP